MRNFINPIRRLHVAVLWGILCVPRLAAGRWQMPSSQVPPPPTCGVARPTSTQVAASLCFLLKKFLISLGASRRVKRGATWNQVRGVANLLNAPPFLFSLCYGSSQCHFSDRRPHRTLLKRFSSQRLSSALSKLLLESFLQVVVKLNWQLEIEKSMILFLINLCN